MQFRGEKERLNRELSYFYKAVVKRLLKGSMGLTLGVRDTRYQMPDTRCRIPDAGCKERYKSTLIELK